MDIDGARNRVAFRGLRIAQSGMSAQRKRLEVAAQNMANAKSFNADGTPYLKKRVELAAIPMGEDNADKITDDPFELRASESADGELDPEDTSAIAVGGVQVVGVTTVNEGTNWVYDPGHPQADANGYVRESNVNIAEEITDTMNASRLFEANASVFDAIKNMLRRATQI